MMAEYPEKDFTRIIKDLCKIGAAYISMMVALMIVLRTFEPSRTPGPDTGLITAQREFDRWLSLSDFFRSTNRTFFESDSWMNFVEDAAEKDIGSSFDRIDIVKQVNSGSEVKRPTPVTLRTPFGKSGPSRLSFVVVSKSPLVLSVMDAGSNAEFGYDLVFIDDRSRGWVVPTGHGITSERSAASVIKRDLLARPREAPTVIAGLRRNGWRAEPARFDELSSGNDIVVQFMREQPTNVQKSSPAMLKAFGFEFPAGWVGVVMPVACFVFLVLVMKQAIEIAIAAFRKQPLLVAKPDDLPYLLQDKVLRGLVSSTPLALTLVALWVVWDSYPRLRADSGFVDGSMLWGLAPMVIAWALVAWSGIVGRFLFQSKVE